MHAHNIHNTLNTGGDSTTEVDVLTFDGGVEACAGHDGTSTPSVIRNSADDSAGVHRACIIGLSSHPYNGVN
ncbi:hypothetical protein SCP_1702880 [Sparassis crispa]|uniref:Uncharacterized protein n=1 Tax=Sparassis crispa TaxID=139825 RepID=A0A401H6C2_9APHY|nr:hypothetical protein SCP_1702880 [Sparassis crispa]GBE89962.1 hypothetical protein SCP_1702880 [Sparassis crispa]